ncbi:hypothetical protein DH86_00003458 [Scytalidium sp. 3C]|nr:hypothetical protein DH86_00003458 [Scytalidium sp. 3C]
MALSRSRAVTLIVALAALTSNTLSALLFHQLPDDPYHLASTFGWYLHFANLLSIFGLIGALRLAFSTADTQGFAGGRFPTGGPESLEEIAREWSPQGCLKIVWLAQLTFAAGLVAATILQFVGALCVREYAKLLWMKDAGDGIVLMIEELGDDDEVRETSIWYRDSFEERSPIQAEFKDARESMDEKSRPLV